MRVIDGSASLDVLADGRHYIVEVVKSKRSWLWAVLNYDPYQTQSLGGSGCLRICGPEVKSTGRAKTWLEAFRTGLRTCNKLALKEKNKLKKKKSNGKKR